MRTVDQLETAVQAGITHLFANDGPSWPNRINTGILDIGEDCDCVLGQLEGSYSNAYGRRMFMSARQPTRLGFWAGDRAEYPLLTTIWKREILNLRHDPEQLPLAA